MKARKRSYGGKASPDEHMYNAEGSPAAKVSEDDKGDGFKKGGRPKKRATGGGIAGLKAGGHVDGHKGHMKMGKRARGGGMHVGHHAAGGSPMSEGHKIERKDGPGLGANHAGDEPPGEKD